MRMDITSIFLITLVGLTALLGIGAVVGLIASTWFILLPLVLLGAALACFDSGLFLWAITAVLVLAGVAWAEYRVWRG
jgi:hypothetical protein